jgi:hypothetical protein
MRRPVFTLTLPPAISRTVTACALGPPVRGGINLATDCARPVEVNEFAKLVTRSSRLMLVVDTVQARRGFARNQEDTEEALVVIQLDNRVGNGPEVSVIRLGQ